MKTKVFVISNTHWDREWYMPHEKYLVRLVSLCDRLVAIMEDQPDYIFISDGQYSMIGDYLAARPEMIDRVKALVSAGRLKVGPWYTQPLETLVSGEAMVRNLHYGIRESEKLGGAMRFSYEVDQFGHASQTPQILSGFGIKGAIAWRGMPKGTRSAFRWESPDGSAVTMLYTNDGYGEATDLPLTEEDFTETIDGINIQRQGLNNRVDTLKKLRSDFADVPVHLWLNGIDHSYAQPDILEAIQKVNTLFPELEVRQATPEELLDAVHTAYAAAGLTMETIPGELMYTRESVLEPTHAAHPRQKLVHYKTERSLERILEPTSAMAWLCSGNDRAWIGERAWKYVLENHAHDTLGCTSVDAVYQEAMSRYQCALSLCEQGSEDARRDVMACFASFPSMVAFNTSSAPFKGVIKVRLDVPAGLGTGDLTLTAADGTEIPTSLLSRRPITDVRYNPRKGHPTKTPGEQIDLLCKLPEVPAYGWLRMNISKPKPVYPRHRIEHFLSAEPGVMENCFLKVKINPNGTFDLTDKLTGVTYPNQFTLEDTGDSGNIYIHLPTLSAETNYSLGSAARINLLYDTALGCAYRVDLTMEIPEGDGSYGFRSQHTVKLDVSLTLTLYADSRLLALHASVTNRASEHRLRALFPTYIHDTDVSRSGQPFDTVERPIHEENNLPGLAEQPYPTHPMQDFCDITGKTHGLTVAAAGIYEYECMDDQSRALAITLMRSNGLINPVDFGDVGQYHLIEGENYATVEYDLALLPHGKNHLERYADVMSFLNPTLLSPMRAPEESVMSDYQKPVLLLPDKGSAVLLTGENLVITAVKKAYDRDSLIVRILNTGSQTSSGRLDFTWPGKTCQAIYRTDLDEVRVESLSEPVFTLAPAALFTIEFAL